MADTNHLIDEHLHGLRFPSHQAHSSNGQIHHPHHHLAHHQDPEDEEQHQEQHHQHQHQLQHQDEDQHQQHQHEDQDQDEDQVQVQVRVQVPEQDEDQVPDQVQVQAQEHGQGHDYEDDQSVQEELSRQPQLESITGKRKDELPPVNLEPQRRRLPGRRPYGSGRTQSSFRFSMLLDRKVKELLGSDTTNKDCNTFLMKAVDAAVSSNPTFLAEFKFSRLIKQSIKGRSKRQSERSLLSGAADEEPIVPETDSSINQEILEHVRKLVLAELVVAKKYGIILLWNKVSRVSRGFSLESFIACLDKFDEVVVERKEGSADVVRLKDENVTFPVDLKTSKVSGVIRRKANPLRFVAKVDWEALSEEQLSVKKGIQMDAYNVKGDQMMVTRLDTKESGLVPLSILEGIS